MHKPTITFVFDDGYMNDYEYALPLFSKYNVPACSAVVSSFIGGKKKGTNECYSGWKELIEMQRMGWEILSHGRTHAFLASISLEEAKKELKESKQELEAIGFKINNFVYPGHKYTEEVRQVACEYYRSCRGGPQGVNGKNPDFFALSSILIDDHKNISFYKQKINEIGDGWIIFYCHLCESKFILSNLKERLDTVEQLIFYSKLKGIKIKTINGVLNEF